MARRRKLRAILSNVGVNIAETVSKMASLSKGEEIIQCGKYFLVVKGKDRIIQKVIDLQAAGAGSKLVQRGNDWCVVTPTNPLLRRVVKGRKAKTKAEKRWLEIKRRDAKAAYKKRKKQGRHGSGLDER